MDLSRILLEIVFLLTLVMSERLVPQNEPKQVLQKVLRNAEVENFNLTFIKSVNLSSNTLNSQIVRPNIDSNGYLLCNTDPRLRLCENDAHYPEKEIILLLKEASNLKLHSSESNLVLPEDTFDYEAKNILPPPCEARTLLFLPRAGISINLRHVYIINVKGFSQPVVLHVCASYMSKCGNGKGGENGICQQRYGLATMKIIHPSEHKILDAQIEVPVACECQRPIVDTLKKQAIKERNSAAISSAVIHEVLLMFCFLMIVKFQILKI